ncbi:hypothetical protein F511_35120 [Dorcoceras hygrometricum]|uniref:Dystroglycan-like n=1 Tax=Dorcoceras hygrometricum TaxID=472368 RepID=A0A2Z7BEI6_9LAMI|nr:hypothetical protein F511_35120 [Dorcoceras hygrometricum]
MAASLIHNAIQVYFDSVFSMADKGMVQMFKALESSGLHGFLGCSSAIYEAALVDFYHNALVQDNKVISSIQGKSAEISEEQFAGIFEFQTEVLTDMNEVPKDLMYDARSAFSAGGEQIKTSCKKNEMKFEFRLLNDIQAKTTVKAGSFDAVTHERFPMMAAIHGGVKINWGRLLFNLLKDMGAPDLELGESKAFRPLKILNSKTVGTYTAENKSINAEEVLEVPVEKVVKKAAIKRIPAPAVAEPAANKKRSTVGRDAPVEKTLEIVPVKEKETPVKKKSVEKMIDSTDTDPLSKVPELTEISKSDEESMTIDELLQQIPEEMMLPSNTAAEPTKIKFVHGIQIKEVYWYKASLPQIEAADKGKAPLSSPIGNLESVSDLAAKEEQMLAWAEIDSLQTAVQRRMYIIVKYREMLLRKFLEARHSNFESGMPTTAIDLKVLDLLSDAHRIVLEKLMEQLKIHKLAWTRPSISSLCGVMYNMVEFFHDFILASIGQVVDIEADPMDFFGVFRRGLDVDLNFSSSSSSQSENPSSSSSSSSNDSHMPFTADDIPEIPSSDDVLQIEETPDVQISLLTAGVPSTDYTEAFVQLRATVDNISLEQVQTKFHIDKLKAGLSKKISSLETAFLTTSDNQDKVVLVQTNILRKEMQDQKAALSEELADIRKELQYHKATIANDLLEFRVKTQEN